jgi:5-methyltetrahydropteroyltriglutamate--homocysteine methyltransferase
MPAPILPTTVVGSYPQPDWLLDRENLKGRFPPRVRAREIWRVGESWLEQAQDDATLLAIREMERAGIDIISDGEMRRESYSNRFATALDGVDIDNPGSALDRSGHPNPVPRVVGPIKRRHAVETRDVEFLRRSTNRTIKITLPGPFTMAQQAQNDFYKDEEELIMAYAAAVNAEAKDLKAAGADVIQLDEPYLQARPEKAKRFGVKGINRALEGVAGPTAVHLCFGYAAIIHARPSGYSFLPELAQSIANQVSFEAAQPSLDLSVVKPLVEAGKTLILGVSRSITPRAPDCGMKYLPRERAFAKLKALAEGAAIVRRELAGRA